MVVKTVSIFVSTLFFYIAIIPITIFTLSNILTLFIISLSIFPILYIKGLKFPLKTNQECLVLAEEQLIVEKLKTSKYRHINSVISFNTELHEYNDIQVHSLVGFNCVENDKPIMLIVHGVMGSSMSSIGIVDHLSENFTIHMIDLPCFGRSHNPHVNLKDKPPSEIVEFYNNILYEYITHNCNGRACIVAHSFGGFLCTKFASKHPNLVEKIIFIDPAGIFPLLCSTGAYWAVFFKFSMLYTILRITNPIGQFICHTIMECTNYNSSTEYFLQLLSSKSDGNYLIGKFISLGFIRSYWAHPTLHMLAKVKVPIGFIYGEKDNILPPHQGLIFAKATNSNIPVNIVYGAFHSPQQSHPKQCAKEIATIYDNVRIVSKIEADMIEKRIPMEVLVKYSGSYCFMDTKKNIEKMYNDVCGFT